MPTARAGRTDVAYRVRGDGSVTVFVTSGVGRSSAEWWPVQDALADRARLVVWDRPGYGDSGRPRARRTLANVAGEARDLLASVAPDGPLVLVGHAEGGLYTNALARLVDARVQGVVLLDPTHPERARHRRGRVDAAPGGFWAGSLLAGLGLSRLVRTRRMQAPPFSYARRHSPEALDAMWRHAARARTYRTALAEYRPLAAGTGRADLQALGPFPPVPIVLLAHDPTVVVDRIVAAGRLPVDEAQRLEAQWGQLLRDRSALSPVGRTETVEGSGHLIHLERPDLTVARIANLVRRRA